MTIQYEVVLFLFVWMLILVENKVIKIRGLGSCQYLTNVQALSWPSWTYDISESILSPVESEDSGTGIDFIPKGWVNPTDFDEIYFPRDLPLPKCRPSLGKELFLKYMAYFINK